LYEVGTKSRRLDASRRAPPPNLPLLRKGRNGYVAVVAPAFAPSLAKQGRVGEGLCEVETKTSLPPHFPRLDTCAMHSTSTRAFNARPEAANALRAGNGALKCLR